MSLSGYIHRKIPQSIEEVISQQSAETTKLITKAAVQKYIESFFDKAGGNHNLFKVIAKDSLKYSIDNSLDLNKDPDLRKLQIARLFEGLRQELPSILITDTSFESIHTNWIGADAVWGDAEFVYTKMPFMRKLGINIFVGTRDISSTDTLHSLLSLLFSELRFEAGGNRITGNYTEGDSWVICLCNPILGQVQRVSIDNDPKDSIYMFSIELPEVLFEDHVVYKKPKTPPPYLNEGIANPPNNSLADVLPEILVPDSISIKENTPVYFKFLQSSIHSFRVSDPNVCTYNPRDQILSPRRLGSFDLQIYKNNSNLTKDPGASLELVTFKRIKVVP